MRPLTKLIIALVVFAARSGAQTVPFSIFTNACVSGGGGGAALADSPAVSNQYITAYVAATGLFSRARPTCANLSDAVASCSTDATNASNIGSGTLAAARLPNPTASTLGGIQSYAAVTNQWINAISTSGVPSSAQPSFANLSSTATAAQTPLAAILAGVAGGQTLRGGTAADETLHLGGSSNGTSGPVIFDGQVLATQAVTNNPVVITGSSAAVTGSGTKDNILLTTTTQGYCTGLGITRSGSTATATCGAGPALGMGSSGWICVSGADQDAYNGCFSASRSSGGPPTVFTYSVSGTPTTPATGTMLASSDGLHVSNGNTIEMSQLEVGTGHNKTAPVFVVYQDTGGAWVGSNGFIGLSSGGLAPRGTGTADANGVRFKYVATKTAQVIGGDGSADGFISDTGCKRVSTQFDKTSDVSLANVTGLSVTVVAGQSYKIDATLYTTSNVAGGVQAAIAGTATATSIIYEAETQAAGAITQTRATALATSVGGVTTVTAATIIIRGLITVNAAGTLTAQFAQNASSGTASSVLVGSTLCLRNIQ